MDFLQKTLLLPSVQNLYFRLKNAVISVVITEVSLIYNPYFHPKVKVQTKTKIESMISPFRGTIFPIPPRWRKYSLFVLLMFFTFFHA